MDTQIEQAGADYAPLTPDQLFARLDEMGIAHQTHRHDPVFTVEEARALRGILPGAHVKNLFLRDKKKRPWLIVCEELQQVSLKPLSKHLGAGNFSFGSADRLMEVLGVEPGSVTPLALINAKDRHAVNVVLDKSLSDSETVNCHPLVNTMTTALSLPDLLSFIDACGFEPRTVDFSELD
ncbi:MAG: prolyl-tRNA synthetase associated domain-containing protein [Pseudomonadota bacterium]